jgi:hypothetical protein
LIGAMFGWLVEEPSTLVDVLMFGYNITTAYASGLYGDIVA